MHSSNDSGFIRQAPSQHRTYGFRVRTMRMPTRLPKHDPKRSSAAPEKGPREPRGELPRPYGEGSGTSGFPVRRTPDLFLCWAYPPPEAPASQVVPPCHLHPGAWNQFSNICATTAALRRMSEKRRNEGFPYERTVSETEASVLNLGC